MTDQQLLQSGNRAQDFVVPSPRACDPVGHALRNAFRGDRSLPDDIAVVLLRLDALR